MKVKKLLAIKAIGNALENIDPRDDDEKYFADLGRILCLDPEEVHKIYLKVLAGEMEQKELDNLIKHMITKTAEKY